MQSILGNSPDRVSGYYSDKIRLMPAFQKTLVGKTNAVLYHKLLLTRFEIPEFTKTEIEIHDLGTRIVEIGSVVMRVKLKSTGQKYSVAGKYLELWERRDGNSLALLTSAWNYDHALEVEDQFRFEEISATDVALAAHLPVTNSTRFELAALNRLMEATVTQHDDKVWTQFYADDAMFMYSRHAIVQGRAALDTFLTKHCKEVPEFEKLDIRNDQVDDLGNYVIEYASHIASWRAGEYSGVGLGKDLRIWRREKNGALKIFRHIGMYD